MMLSELPTARPRRFSRLERRHITIETTLASLARNGAEGTSLRSVCRDMGVAPSLITHSFTGWHEILAASYGLLTERFLGRLTPLLTQKLDDEPARMRAIIDVYLATDWDGENMMGAMIAFWHLSRTVPELKTPFDRFLRDRHRLLSQAVAALAEDAGANIDSDEVTASFILMMDGIWLHMSLKPDAIAAARARAMCWAWIAERLGQPSWRAAAALEELELAVVH